MRTRLAAALLALLLAAGGTVALIAYVRGADARALEGTRTVNVLVATQAIPRNTPAKSLVGLVAVKALPEMAVLPDRVTSLDQLGDQVALTELLPGEQLVHARFADVATARSRQDSGLPEGTQEVTVLLEPQRAIGGHIAAGDTVGVFLSFAEPESTHVKFHKVLVTRVQAAPMAKAGGEETASAAADAGPAPLPSGNYLVSLAVNAPMAERIVFASEFGTIWLSSEPLNADESGASVVNRESVYK